MDANEKKLALFTTRMRQMILLFQETKKENDDLYSMVDQLEKQIGELKAQLDKSKRDYESLKMAQILTATSTDVEDAKKKIAHIIRDIDKCITLLSDKE